MGKIFETAGEIKKSGGVDKLKKNFKGIQALGQGIHALQDAVAHHGEDYANYSIIDDLYPSSATENRAKDVTTGALVVSEVMSGAYSRIKDKMSINIDGMTSGQFGQFLQQLLVGMNEQKVDQITIKIA